MVGSTNSTWETTLLSGAVLGGLLLVEGGLFWLFLRIIAQEPDFPPQSGARLLALGLVLLGVIAAPAGALRAWFVLPGHEPTSLVVARAAGGKASAEAAPFSLARASPERGKQLFQEMNCLACHRLWGQGGTVAPDLWEVANRREAEWIFRHFKNPQEVSPGTLMPRFPLSDDQFRDLTAYLLTLRDNP